MEPPQAPTITKTKPRDRLKQLAAAGYTTKLIGPCGPQEKALGFTQVWQVVHAQDILLLFV